MHEPWPLMAFLLSPEEICIYYTITVDIYAITIKAGGHDAQIGLQ